MYCFYVFFGWQPSLLQSLVFDYKNFFKYLYCSVLIEFQKPNYTSLAAHIACCVSLWIDTDRVHVFFPSSRHFQKNNGETTLFTEHERVLRKTNEI